MWAAGTVVARLQPQVAAAALHSASCHGRLSALSARTPTRTSQRQHQLGHGKKCAAAGPARASLRAHNGVAPTGQDGGTGRLTPAAQPASPLGAVAPNEKRGVKGKSLLLGLCLGFCLGLLPSKSQALFNRLPHLQASTSSAAVVATAPGGKGTVAVPAGSVQASPAAGEWEAFLQRLLPTLFVAFGVTLYWRGIWTSWDYLVGTNLRSSLLAALVGALVLAVAAATNMPL